MQIVIILLTSALLVLLQTQGCNQNRTPSDTRVEPDTRSASQSKNLALSHNDYRLATTDCYANKSCLAFVSVSKKLQNSKSLVELSEVLSRKNPSKETLVIYFFNSFNMAKSFAEGKLHATELESYAVGAYRYDDKEEYFKMRVLKEHKPKKQLPEWRIIFKRPTK